VVISLERLLLGEPTSWGERQGNIFGAVNAWRRGSSGVSAQGMHTLGSAQEPGRTLRSPRSDPGLDSGSPTGPGPQVKGAGTLWERSSGRNRGTAKRRKRSAAGWTQGVLAP